MTTTKIPCLNDGFVQLIDHMGSDSSICNAARVSYGNHETKENKELKAWKQVCPNIHKDAVKVYADWKNYGLYVTLENREEVVYGPSDSMKLLQDFQCAYTRLSNEYKDRDRNLIRYLMRHRHTTPFEMVSFVFLVRAPIHVARQWFRHRTWSYNEYSTRYKPAIDSFETTDPDKWRTQATNNKQGSGEYITGTARNGMKMTQGEFLSIRERDLHEIIADHYQEALDIGVAREQARKDLPLSTYTEFYAKVDLHNLFHFLSLRLDGHAQLEIRTYAEAISQLIKPIVPISYQAFEDYRLNGCSFSAQEMELIKEAFQRSLESTQVMKEFSYDETMSHEEADREWYGRRNQAIQELYPKPDSLSVREWNEFKEKLS